MKDALAWSIIGITVAILLAVVAYSLWWDWRGFGLAYAVSALVVAFVWAVEHLIE